MRRIGFSTGALAKSDFRTGLELQRNDCTAIELSALREEELRPLLTAIPLLDLQSFDYVSVHAPSELMSITEEALTNQLMGTLEHVDGIVVHPNMLQTASLWIPFGDKLLIENMDQRKPIGRTAKELQRFFDQLPFARLCFDLGHARQVDPTLAVSMEILEAYGSRLAEIHISEVDASSNHVAISGAACASYRKLASLIAEDVPVIIESVIPPESLEAELAIVRESLCEDAVPA